MNSARRAFDLRPTRWTLPLLHRAKVAAGGRAQLRFVAVLAAVISLDGIDKGTLSVNAGPLEHAFGIDNAAIGLLASMTSLTGALFMIPCGVLTDRVNRVRLLSGSILLWAVATVLSGLAPSFGWLLAARVGLAAVTATATPTIASLIGDTAPTDRRARLYSYILVGEALGSGAGFLVSNAVTGLLSWRYSIAWPAVPALATAWLVHRMPEPDRGGAPRTSSPAGARSSGAEEPQDAAQRQVARDGVAPDPRRILRQDPSTLPLRRAFHYVLRTPTVIVMILASAFGYSFFAGVRTFAIVFATGHYGVGRAAVTGLTLVLGAGGVVGLLAGGRAADALLHRGRASARVLLPAAVMMAAPLVFAPAIATSSPAAALPLLTVGTGLLTAANPPLDAARLDVIPAGLWGRAESIRTVVRTVLEAGAPLFFGYLSSDVFGGRNGLEYAFLLCTGPLLGSGALTLLALRTYPRDVATANASNEQARRPPAARDGPQPDGVPRNSRARGAPASAPAPLRPRPREPGPAA